MTGERARAVYDRIGVGYRSRRQPEPRWQQAIDEAIDGAASVLNVGAGAGSYEPLTTRVVAVEPSETMIDQRPGDLAPVLRGVAEHLPVRDHSFEVALAVLTVHHWADPPVGLAELRRAARRQIVVTWEPELSARFWLASDYLPEIASHEATLATLPEVHAGLDVIDTIVLPVPADCADGFMAAYWRRPQAYLDPKVRNAISSLSLIDQRRVDEAMGRLAHDVDDGAWARQHADLLALEQLDVGYRLVIAEG